MELTHVIYQKNPIKSLYCTTKIHKCKSIEEAIALANNDYVEAYQPDDLKERSMVSDPESPTQRLTYIIELKYMLCY